MLKADYDLVLSGEMPLCTWVHLLIVYLLWYLCYGIAVRISPQLKKLTNRGHRIGYNLCCVLFLLSAAAIVMLLFPLAAYVRILTKLQSTWSADNISWSKIPKAAAVQRRMCRRQQWKDEASYLKGIRHRSSRCRAVSLLWYRWSRWCGNHVATVSELVYKINLQEALVNTLCVSLWAAAMLWNVLVLLAGFVMFRLWLWLGLAQLVVAMMKVAYTIFLPQADITSSQQFTKMQAGGLVPAMKEYGCVELCTSYGQASS